MLVYNRLLGQICRYNVTMYLTFSFGRQLTALGYEGDEAPGLYAVSNAYLFGSSDHALVNIVIYK